MTQLLLIALVKICGNVDYTKIQTQECASHFGNCVENYSNKDQAYKECTQKWEKVKDDIK